MIFLLCPFINPTWLRLLLAYHLVFSRVFHMHENVNDHWCCCQQRVWSVFPGKGVTVVGIHPLVAYTKLRDKSMRRGRWMLPFFKLSMKTPLQAAQTTIFAALDPSVVNGKMYRSVKEFSENTMSSLSTGHIQMLSYNNCLTDSGPWNYFYFSNSEWLRNFVGTFLLLWNSKPAISEGSWN